MITKDNFSDVLIQLGFEKKGLIYTKHFDSVDCDLKADFSNQKLIYPEDKGFEVNDGTTSNFEHPENFVVFECVNRLFEKGYRPEHIELEPRWSLGHGGKSGKADICVKNKDGSPYLCIIECKTADKEYNKELQNMKADGGQLFSYWQQSKATKWLVLYASDFDSQNHKITYTTATVNCSDDANFLELAKDDKSLKLYKDAATVETLYEVWKETYEQKFFGDIIFDDETIAYDIGVLPLKKKRLVDFNRDDKIVNQFEEILRHNNVSDKENAFNRLIALFIAKLYDEKTKSPESEVEFQYKTGTDTYQKMQDRLQKLHHLGMKDFMKEDVFYVADDYVKKVMKNAIGENREQLEAELNETITKLKFYTNNDFAFKDVHNKALFYQNGKILVEMVDLFQKYRIIDSNELQLLGDMFEQLLNKGFKQNEGQFFTPIPITCFIWKCLPLESIVKNEEKNEIRYPKVIDYACGAGHFLTEGFREINETIRRLGLQAEKGWERDCVFGIEKDYRLARVSKISMFMHGADNGNVVFGDGLDNHNEKIVIENGQFDILVANPPYSVKAFSEHLDLKHNELKILNDISKNGSEIETLFVERIAQLLRPKGIAAVILPSSILSNSSASYISAREEILKNFTVHAIVQLGSKTFGATGTNTVILCLRKNDEPPIKSEIAKDNVKAIFENDDLNVLSDKEILDSYCERINVRKDDYIAFLKNAKTASDWEKYKEHAYFGMYANDFEKSSEFKKLKSEKISKAFFDFATDIEKEKLYFFALVHKQKTLVVTSPSDNAEQENFLGYTWSNRKGDEGIKIKSSEPQKSCGLLYNVADEKNSIASYVKDSFVGIYRTGKYISVNALKDMIDFSRTTFDKAIKTSVQGENGKLKIESKYELVKLGDVTEIQKGKSITSANLKDGSVKVVAGGIDYAYLHNEANRPANIITVSASGANAGFVNYWNEPIFASDCTTILAKDKLTTKYVFNVLKAYQELVFHLQKGAAQPHVYADDLKSLQIPLPPIDVQKSIVAECEEIDDKYQKALQEIADSKAKIAEIMANVQGEKKRLGEMAKSISTGPFGTMIHKEEYIQDGEYCLINPQDIVECKVCYDSIARISETTATRLERYKLQKNDIVLARRGDLSKCAIITEKDKNCLCGTGSFFIQLDNAKIDSNFFLHLFVSKDVQAVILEHSIGLTMPNLNQTILNNLELSVPSIAEQKRVIAKISNLEDKIAQAKQIMAACPQKKQAVLDKWLR